MGDFCPGFELLSAYVDGETSPSEAGLVARHLPTCASCRATLAGFEAIGARLAAVPEISCAAARPLLSAELDGEIGAAEHQIAIHHLAGCADCGAARVTWQAVDSALAAMPIAYPSPAADAHIRALAVHGRARALPAPNFGRAFASVGVIAAMVALVVVGALQQGGGPAPATSALLGGPSTALSVQQLFNPGNGLLYVLEPPKTSLFVRQPATLQTVATIPIGGTPEYLALNTGSKTIYVLDPAAKSYTEVDTEQNVVRQRVPIDVTGTPTSIEVNTETGKIVIATAPTPATSATTSKPGELAIIDPSSRKLEATKQVELAPTRIVVDRTANRLYLLGASSVSILDATTYEKVDTIGTGAVALALSASGGAPAILSQRDGRATLSFYRGGSAVSFDGRAAGLASLADGGFAVLLDTADGGVIRLVDANGAGRGTAFRFTGSAAAVSYDDASGRFIAADGHTIAQVSGGLLAAASIAPSVAPSVAPSIAPSIAPTATVAPVPTASAPATATPLVALPTPTPAPTLFPGAVLSAVGVYRFEMANNVPAPIAVTSGAPGRIWFAGADGTIRSVDTRTGSVVTAAVLGTQAHITQMAYGGDRVFALDARRGDLYILDTRDLHLVHTATPFGETITSIDVAPDGRLWFASPTFSGLLAYDPRTTHFDFLFLDQGTSPVFLTVDLSGRVWFSDPRHAILSSYEPATKLLLTYPLGAGAPVTALRADRNGTVWAGTSDGDIFELRLGVLVKVRSVGYPVAALAPAGDTGVVALFRAGPATLFGDAAGQLFVGTGDASAVVSGNGDPWLADGVRAVFYIAHP